MWLKGESYCNSDKSILSDSCRNLNACPVSTVFYRYNKLTWRGILLKTYYNYVHFMFDK